MNLTIISGYGGGSPHFSAFGLILILLFLVFLGYVVFWAYHFAALREDNAIRNYAKQQVAIAKRTRRKK